MMVYVIHVFLNFNPRSHKGSDVKCSGRLPGLCISIHAPTRGATLYAFHRDCIGLYFNPRSHKGSDVVRFYHDVIHI